MRRLLFFSLFLVTMSTSTPTSLSERTLNDFGTLNLGLWNVDLNAVYDFFAAPAVQRNFFIVQTSKVGYFQLTTGTGLGLNAQRQVGWGACLGDIY